jgi:hypothetical protein
VPVVLVFTKFDEFVTEVPRDEYDDETQYHASALAEAQEMYIDSCRRLFDKDPSEVPAVVVSGTFISQTICREIN